MTILCKVWKLKILRKFNQTFLYKISKIKKVKLKILILMPLLHNNYKNNFMNLKKNSYINGNRFVHCWLRLWMKKIL